MVQNDPEKTQKYKKKLVQKALRVDDEEEMAQGIKCDREALQMAEKLLEYARFKGNEKLSLVLSKSTVLLQEIVIQNQKQFSISDYFKK